MSVRNRKYSLLHSTFTSCQGKFSGLIGCQGLISIKIVRFFRKYFKWILLFKIILLVYYPLHLFVINSRPILEPGEYELLLVSMPKSLATNNRSNSLASSHHRPAPFVIANPIGGLGNQMFEYACAYSVARALKTHLWVQVPKETNASLSLGLRPTERKFGLENFNIGFMRPVSGTDFFSDKNLPMEEPDERQILDYIYDIRNSATSSVLNVRVYCESEVYFKPYRNEIMESFQFTSSALNLLLTAAVKQLLDEMQESESVAVHLRRGDFMTVGGSLYRVLPVSYYKKAMVLMRERLRDPTFYIFTDDLVYAKSLLEEAVDVVYVSSVITNSSLQDFLSMTKCRHLILANSSFSWWAAYLNANADKKVIAPFPKYKGWYMNAKYKFLEKYYLVPTFYPSDWETINPWE